MGQSPGTPKEGMASGCGDRGKMPRLHQTDRCARSTSSAHSGSTRSTIRG